MNVVVVGGGPGGTEVATRTARRGHRVTVMESDRFGGTCTNRGCIPTKFLMAAVEQELQSSGRVSAEAWEKMQARKRALVGGLSRSIERDLVAMGVTVVKGRGSLVSPRQVAWRDRQGESGVVACDAVVLATGSEPAALPGFEVDGRRVLTSEDAMNLDRVPATLLVIGSGFIGSEYARIFRLLGTEVTILEALPQILPAEDEETAAVIRKEFERSGIRIISGRRVASVAPHGDGARAVLSDGESLDAELALVSVGRILNSAGLGLEKAGLEAAPGGAVAVNDYLETTVPGIYAVGDVTGKLQLAHVATMQGMLVAERLDGGTRRADYGAVPWVVFVSPEVATAGLTEKAARARGIEPAVGRAPLSLNIKARLERTQSGFVKLLAEPETGRLLGGTVVAPRAADMIHTLSLALQAGLTVRDLARTVLAHPTLSESFRDAAENCELA